ncbi:glyoxal oxidase, partial [Mycena floridula]
QMFVGNTKKVYIIDKAEGNAEQIHGHPAWGSVWDIDTHDVELMDIKTNVFCASGMHLPNGSYTTFGGNGAITTGGAGASNPDGTAATFDPLYQDYDGRKSIRILDPCTDNSCQWFDDPSVNSMQRGRWYSAAEPLGDGTIVLLGGFTSGGYVNRNFPNLNPSDTGGAENTYETWPSTGQPQTVQFLLDTSGLNAYAHTFLMPSGKMFVQSNLSTMSWDTSTNAETRLPDMPNGVVRVYPASGAVAMLPLTPANGYVPTILFCGGSDMAADDYGNYKQPVIDTWKYPASKDCQRITPEPADGSSPVYIQDDDMLEGRTMGQFVILPDGKLLVVNGGLNGTAGYSETTNQTLSYSDMPYGLSLASGPVGTPAIYDPKAPAGSRWSNAGLGTSPIARLYHSSAILLPDASVLIAGSNPSVDVNLTAVFPTEYRSEIFYPPYFSSSTKPEPSGIPSTLSYGGSPFDITIPGTSYSGSANDAAESAMVSVVRPGWTTHAMSMGQRFLQLNTTYTVNQDSSITLHTSQMPPNPNLFQPGPAFVYVVIGGIPSSGSYVIVGNGVMGKQPTAAVDGLPGSVRLDGVKGSGSGSSSTDGGKKNSATQNLQGAFGALIAALTLLSLVC